MGKHTPGPWKMVFEDGDRKIIAPPQDPRLGLRETLMCDMQYYPWCPTKEADWRLIAAAPELLEALRLFAGDNATHTERERIESARAAIAKATVEA